MPHHAFSGAQKWAELLHNTCILSGPQRQARKENQNRLPPPCFLWGPNVGGIGTQPLHSWGSPTPNTGTKSEFVAPPLPSLRPKSGWNCYVTTAFPGGPKQGNEIRIGYLTLACSGAQKVGAIATQPLHSRGSPLLGPGRKSELAASPLPSPGPKNGRNCYATPAFSGVPNAKRGDGIRIGCLTRAFSGAQKWAELLRNPCILGGPQRQARAENQNSLPHPYLLRGPKVGGIATQPLHSGASRTRERNRNWVPHPCLLWGPKFAGIRTQPLHSEGSATPRAGRNSQLAASPLPSLGPKSGQNCYATPAFSGVRNAKHRKKIRIGCLTLPFSRAQKWAESLRNRCILGDPQRQARVQKQNWLSHPVRSRAQNWGELVRHRAFSGKRGDKIRIGCLTPASAGPQKWEELLRNPYILGCPQRQAPRRNQNSLPHPCLLRGPQVGGFATKALHSRESATPSAATKTEFAASPLHSRGSPTPNAGIKSELAASLLDSLRPKSGRNCNATLAFSRVTNSKRGD